MPHDPIVSTRVNDFHAVRIALASPADILAWSEGEVTRPDTINYRTHKPERGGLFCEKIFGPEKDHECACGKLRGLKHKNRVCDRCGVEVTLSRVRRKRMGHIDLLAPVVHVWFRKSRPSILGQLLGIKATDLEGVVHYRVHVVLAPGTSKVPRGEILTDDDARKFAELHGDGFRTGTGAEAIEEMLLDLDLPRLADDLRQRLDVLVHAGKGASEHASKIVRRLEVVESLANSPNRPEWMVLRRIPVIPPDLRPVVLLDSGNYASSDLNDLYRRVLVRNIRLKKLVELRAPEVILRNEKRLLQQAVDALFDNSRTENPVLGSTKQPLKSLADMLQGKQGRFRENLLGKRVDYSGRSVIVVGPELKLHQCGLPKVMALELYQPFLVRKLLEDDRDLTVQRARKMLHAGHPAIWDALEVAMRGHPVLLNRAPTLHRMGIQAFEPVLVEGNAIRLHPLVCKAFNADFDGDQMAVHLPLSVEAIAEAKTRMMAANNVFSPANGQPILGPSKDMVLGCYYLTASVAGETPPRAFASIAEVLHAHDDGKLGVQDAVVVRLGTGSRVATTVGRVIFNDILPPQMPFVNLPMDGKNLARVIADCQTLLGRDATVALLERIKQLGFHHATRSGVSFATDDLCTPAEREEVLAGAQRQADKLRRAFEQGDLDEADRREKTILLWEQTNERLRARLLEELARDRRAEQSVNPIHAMLASGARCSPAQIGQLAGMRGLMRKPSGEVLETPIKSNFREGLNSQEYWNSTHGARKGLVDMALRTADSGYLTRKLVDVAQHVVVTCGDCGTREGIRRKVTMGRVSLQTIRHPLTDAVVVAEGEMVTAAALAALKALGVQELVVRSPMKCRAEPGVCQRCYGMDLATGELVAPGTAVGVIAAQSIGEPATQLTLRNFQTGGVASGADITLSLPRVIELFEAQHGKRAAVLAEVAGRVRIGTQGVRRKKVVFVQLLDGQGRPVGEEMAHVVPKHREVLVAEGVRVEKGQPLTTGTLSPHELLRIAGKDAARLYLLDEVQKVYRHNGVEMDDKHVEVIVGRMLGKVKVVTAGDTKLLPGQVVDRPVFAAANAAVGPRGRLAEKEELLLGVSKAAVRSASFLSAASFQETTKVLTEAALAGKVDPLTGLKENVLLGHLVPAGTGFRPAVEPCGPA